MEKKRDPHELPKPGNTSNSSPEFCADNADSKNTDDSHQAETGAETPITAGGQDLPEGESVPQVDFPIVGIGASAGGLEALEAFVSGLSRNSGIAFVGITHTHPKHTTRLPELLRRKSPLPVALLEDCMKLEPDAIYVPPSDKNPIFENGVIRLQERKVGTDVQMPIDLFLTSLAEQFGEAAGCVILSGTGTDGTGGLRRIKENAGVAAAQNKESAKHEGMPQSAIETGLVDYVLEPAEIARQLVNYFADPVRIQPEDPERVHPSETLSELLSFLARQSDHDFSQYKKNTLLRRIERRMNVNGSRTMEDYLRFLHAHPNEIQALFQDLLIGVTNFFRDPEVFDHLRDHVLPDLLSHEKGNGGFRAWVPGCATGEEAYSVAIIIKEAMERLDIHRQFQIFATDADGTAIAKARMGIYPENITTDVSNERLKRFFIKEGNYYAVKKEIREPIIFARQNVLRDPPFMHLDLLVCRNLLIYLEPAAQNKLLPLFHYNLKTGGILLLGTSENTGRFAELFQPVTKKLSIYKKRDTKIPFQHQQPFHAGKKPLPNIAPGREKKAGEAGEDVPDISRIIKENLLEHHTPPCVIVEGNGNLVYVHGRTGKYLEHSQGRPNLRITELAREGLRYALSSALRRAAANREAVVQSGVRVKTNGDYVHINLRVKPLEGALKDNFMILFEEMPDAPGDGKTSEADAAGAMENSDEATCRRISELEQELEQLREDYRSTQEELEASNEELKSSNEEMYSANEELQSTNEELESSREELESLNEELSTVNAELNDKVNELHDVYQKITEVLNSTGIAIIFLDNDLVIRRFTEEAGRIINLIDKDVGRPIGHISHNLEGIDLTGTVRRVSASLIPYESEVCTTDGHWYRMRIMVHRTKNTGIEGAVLTFINIDAQKEAQKDLEQNAEQAVIAANVFAESIIDTVRESLLVLDGDKNVVMANRRFYETFHASAENTEGRSLFELGGGQWDIAELRGLLDEIKASDQVLENYPVEHHFKTIGFKKMRLNARLLRAGKSNEDRILLAIEDVTGRQ